jgi:hypothetical protein
VGAINSALTDFYRQTILQAGKDVAGYMTDAVNDPISFAHAITPSLAALGPITSEIPTVLKGVTRLVGSPIIPENQDLVLNNEKGICPGCRHCRKRLSVTIPVQEGRELERTCPELIRLQRSYLID